jgi:hypothetical protein
MARQRSTRYRRCVTSRPGSTRTGSSSTCSGPRPSNRRRPSPEQHLHELDGDLVELPGPQQRLGGARAVHQDVAATRRGPGPLGALVDVGDEAGAARRDVVLVHVVGEHEDRHAVVVVALPPPGQLERAPAGDHGAGGERLAVHLPVGAVGAAVVEPVEQPPARAAELLAGAVVGACDEAVEGHGHVEHEPGHDHPSAKSNETQRVGRAVNTTSRDAGWASSASTIPAAASGGR